jgi:hypothetical protein
MRWGTREGSWDMGRILRRYLVPLVLLLALIVAAAAFQRVRAVLTILTIFPRRAILFIVFVLLVDEAVKIARWRFFVRAAGIPLGARDAATSFLAGQTASVLPGGDLLRVRLAVEHGVLPRIGITISFAMWATDMMTLPLLALAGYGKHLVARWALFLPLVIPVALLALVRSARFARFVSRVLGRFRLTRQYALSEDEIEHVTRLLTRPRIVLGGIAFAAVMRLGFAAVLLVITNVINDRPVRFETILSAHALSTLAGSIPFASGLLALGSLVEMLHARGVARTLGVLISLTNRLIAVALNVSIGFVVLLLRYRAVLTGRAPAIPQPAPPSVPASPRPPRHAAAVSVPSRGRWG